MSRFGVGWWIPKKEGRGGVGNREWSCETEGASEGSDRRRVRVTKLVQPILWSVSVFGIGIDAGEGASGSIQDVLCSLSLFS